MQTKYIGGSTAYDLERFQARPRMHIKKPTLMVAKPNQAVRVRAKISAAIKLALVLALLVMVVVTTLYSRAILTELTFKLNAAATELETVKSDGVILSTELESKVSLRNVEEYATQILGMSAMDKKQVTYVDLSDGDKVELTSESPHPTLFQRIELAVNNVQEYIAKS